MKMKKTRKFVSALITVCLLLSAAAGEPVWPKSTGGQQQLAALVEKLNENLISAGEQPVNSLFEAYKTFADFGITDQTDGEIPEGVEFHAELNPSTIDSMILRVNDTERFATIAGCLLKAISPDQFAESDAAAIPKKKILAAQKEPTDSFEETVTDLNGTIIRTYYAYYPNQYHDGNDWMQLTVIFPLEGYADVSWTVVNELEPTNAPDTYLSLIHI